MMNIGAPTGKNHELRSCHPLSLRANLNDPGVARQTIRKEKYRRRIRVSWSHTLGLSDFYCLQTYTLLIIIVV